MAGTINAVLYGSNRNDQPVGDDACDLYNDSFADDAACLVYETCDYRILCAVDAACGLDTHGTRQDDHVCRLGNECVQGLDGFDHVIG